MEKQSSCAFLYHQLGMEAVFKVEGNVYLQTYFFANDEDSPAFSSLLIWQPWSPLWRFSV